MRRNYKNGVMEGLYEEWRMRGLKKNRSRGKMKNGEMDGKWTYWHPNGHKECEVVCKNGELIDGKVCLLYTSPSPLDGLLSRIPYSA